MDSSPSTMDHFGPPSQGAFPAPSLDIYGEIPSNLNALVLVDASFDDLPFLDTAAAPLVDTAPSQSFKSWSQGNVAASAPFSASAFDSHTTVMQSSESVYQVAITPTRRGSTLCEATLSGSPSDIPGPADTEQWDCLRALLEMPTSAAAQLKPAHPISLAPRASVSQDSWATVSERSQASIPPTPAACTQASMHTTSPASVSPMSTSTAYLDQYLPNMHVSADTSAPSAGFPFGYISPDSISAAPSLASSDYGSDSDVYRRDSLLSNYSEASSFASATTYSDACGPASQPYSVHSDCPTAPSNPAVYDPSTLAYHQQLQYARVESGLHLAAGNVAQHHQPRYHSGTMSNTPYEAPSYSSGPAPYYDNAMYNYEAENTATYSYGPYHKTAVIPRRASDGDLHQPNPMSMASVGMTRVISESALHIMANTYGSHASQYDARFSTNGYQTPVHQMVTMQPSSGHSVSSSISTPSSHIVNPSYSRDGSTSYHSVNPSISSAASVEAFHQGINPQMLCAKLNTAAQAPVAHMEVSNVQSLQSSSPPSSASGLVAAHNSGASTPAGGSEAAAYVVHQPAPRFAQIINYAPAMGPVHMQAPNPVAYPHLVQYMHAASHPQAPPHLYSAVHPQHYQQAYHLGPDVRQMQQLQAQAALRNATVLEEAAYQHPAQQAISSPEAPVTTAPPAAPAVSKPAVSKPAVSKPAKKTTRKRATAVAGDQAPPASQKPEFKGFAGLEASPETSAAIKSAHMEAPVKPTAVRRPGNKGQDIRDFPAGTVTKGPGYTVNTPKGKKWACDCDPENCFIIFNRFEHLKRHWDCRHAYVKRDPKWFVCAYAPCSKLLQRGDNLKVHNLSHYKLEKATVKVSKTLRKAKMDEQTATLAAVAESDSEECEHSHIDDQASQANFRDIQPKIECVTPPRRLPSKRKTSAA